MKKTDGFTKILMILSLVMITIVFVLLGYIILTDQKNSEVYEPHQSELVQNQEEVTEEIEDIISKEVTEDEIITASNLFYVQLDDSAKIMYRALQEHKEDMKAGDYRIEFGYQFNSILQQEGGMEQLNESFQSAWNAYRFDHMDVFYLDVKKIFLFTKTITKDGKSTYEVSLGAKDGESYLREAYPNKEAVEKAEKEIKQVTNELVTSAKGNDEQKIRGIHNWMVNNLSYATQENLNSNAYDIYGALIEKNAVCEGYARTFKLLMDEIGIPCLLIAGTATNSNGETESHAWNYVFLNHTWYAVDVTWDDPIILGNGMLSEERRYTYYLKGSNEFFQTHKQNGILSENSMEFLYPELAKENYKE